jgi:hypothetical protein
MNRTAIQVAPVVGAVVLAGVVLWALAAGSGARVGREVEWNDYTSLAGLVDDSDLVLVAELVFVENVRLEHEYPNGDRTFSFRKVSAWKPVEVISGPSVDGVVYVGTGDAEASVGEPYVLFLRSRGTEDGEAPWILTGEPYFARVAADGSLLFVATRRFREEWDVGGTAFPVEGSDAPFAASLEDVRRLGGPALKPASERHEAGAGE